MWPPARQGNCRQTKGNPTPPQVESEPLLAHFSLRTNQVVKLEASPTPRHGNTKVRLHGVTACIFLPTSRKSPLQSQFLSVVFSRGDYKKTEIQRRPLWLGTLFIPRYHEALHSNPSCNRVPQQHGYSECSHHECWQIIIQRAVIPPRGLAG